MGEEEACSKYRELIDKRRLIDGCWVWTGPRQRGKVPVTCFRKKCITVRRCMYLLINRLDTFPSPVYNACGNGLCFNPEHLTVERPKERQFL